MDLQNGRPADATYDRCLLLFGPKRHVELDLWEVQRHGVDCYGDAEHVCVYGMGPADWFARGVRLLGRTAVECTADGLAKAIAEDVSAVAARAPVGSGAMLLDLFAGSGNTLYWLQKRIPRCTGVGFELEPEVFVRTRDNLAILGAPIEIRNIDYEVGLTELDAPHDQLVVVFIAPPWGDALDPVDGLDLRRTRPAVAHIVDVLTQRFPADPLLVAIELYEKVDADSLAELTSRLRWSTVHQYGLNAAGQNHGLLLGTHGWAPA